MTKYVKLVVFVPLTHTESVRKALGDAGAGKIGNYGHCSFSSVGIGRYIPLDGAKPAIGQVGAYEEVQEERIEVLCGRVLLQEIVSAMKQVHPYEEVAYDIYPVEDVI